MPAQLTWDASTLAYFIQPKAGLGRRNGGLQGTKAGE